MTQHKDTTLDDLLDMHLQEIKAGHDSKLRDSLIQWRDKAVVEELEVINQIINKKWYDDELDSFQEGFNMALVRVGQEVRKSIDQLKETPNED